MLQPGKNAMDALEKLIKIGERRRLGLIDIEKEGYILDGTVWYGYKDGMIMLTEADGNSSCFSLRMVRELAEALKGVKYD